MSEEKTWECQRRVRMLRRVCTQAQAQMLCCLSVHDPEAWISSCRCSTEQAQQPGNNSHKSPVATAAVQCTAAAIATRLASAAARGDRHTAVHSMKSKSLAAPQRIASQSPHGLGDHDSAKKLSTSPDLERQLTHSDPAVIQFATAAQRRHVYSSKSSGSR